MSSTLPVFVINLERSPGRKDYMSQHLQNKGIDFEFIKAVDGKLLTDKELKKWYCNKSSMQFMQRELIKAEVACALSHINLYKKIVDEKISGAVILEDDIKVADNFKDIIQQTHLNTNATQSVVIQMNYHKYYLPLLKKEIFQEYNAYPIKPIWSRAATTCGYYITYKAAKDLLSYYDKVWHVIDHWNHLVDRKIIQLSCIVPCCVSQKEEIESDIKLETIIKFKRPPKYYRRKYIRQILIKLRIIKKQKGQPKVYI
ncbi:Glycosyltransferase family 25 (LPS biosynthesis protein) [Piscirickettsia salmonis]|uniref:glycosyltransferase family 25 protein n=1 Tax=Piscirickettsia salmonis TaxID=1238 RepID=UPI0018ACA851|nr:glycosyltransferase family 25 protein [Piscirickettsia salmonis]QGP56123.1 Glycosyltransferase family 25 (LPS biosynthesis protein) [Piscirickettsia salmonis]QGP58008.1 Glycosyltransferase family 25 (LPS biosynthesis protein) [Piscirickettsia salmonis]QGP65692.1 Glycosyltransferase family 25 (LPS biosynthesis protein) [Piscirickettsia salmonis]